MSEFVDSVESLVFKVLRTLVRASFISYHVTPFTDGLNPIDFRRLLCIMFAIMESLFIVLAFGTIFILLGRWFYRNPKRLYPGWGLLNRESPNVQKLGRAYATFVIFFGSLACASVIVLRLIPGSFSVILGLATAVGATLLLRPRLRNQPAPTLPVAPDPIAVPREQKILSPHWKRNLGIIAGLAGVFVILLFVLIGNSDICKLAFATAQMSPTLRQHLGEPLKRGFFMSGNIETSGPSGKADIAIPISGPRGRGTLYAVATRSAGVWKLETLQVEVKDGTGRMDLLTEGRETIPPVQ